MADKARAALCAMRGELDRHRYSQAQLAAERRRRGGCRKLAIAQSSGALVGLYRAEEADMDPAGGPWVVLCETHGYLDNHATLRGAKSWLMDTEEWCNDCRQLAHGANCADFENYECVHTEEEK